LSQEAIELGRAEYQRDLARVRDCTEKNHWPGFTEEITVIGLPAWMQKQAEGLL
jgi:hypothetical protein